MNDQLKKPNIFKALAKVKKMLETEHRFNVWGIFLQGSQNYNLDIYEEGYTSDIDMKAFIIPTFDELYSGKKKSDLYTTEFGQVEVKDIRLFHELLKNANPAAIELLFTDYKIVKSHSFIFNLANAIVEEKKFLIYKAMSKTVFNKLKTLFTVGNARKEEFERCGYDPKELHHILRGRNFLERFTEHNNYKKAMFYDEKALDDSITREWLIDFKVAKEPLPADVVKAYAEQAVAAADYLAELHPISKYPITDTALDFVYDVIKDIIKAQMLVETKHKSKEAFQYHSHFGQLTKEQRMYLENLGLGINKEHFVDLLEYREYELVNFWPIEYKRPEPEATLDAQEFEKERNRDSETSELLSPLD